MPALLTSTSSLPKCRVVLATTAAQLSSLVTSSGSYRAEAPIASATWRPSCSSTSAMTTLAPSRANICAVAAPMPDAAPDMIATLVASLITLLPLPERVPFQFVSVMANPRAVEGLLDATVSGLDDLCGNGADKGIEGLCTNGVYHAFADLLRVKTS